MQIATIETLEWVGSGLVCFTPDHDRIVTDPRECIMCNGGVAVETRDDQSIAIEACEVAIRHLVAPKSLF